MKNSDTLNVKRSDSPTAGDDPGHAVGDPRPASLNGRPHGFTVGHAVGDPRPASLNGRPHGFTVGHAIGARSTPPTELRPSSRAPGDQGNIRTLDRKPALTKRAA
jgi:hypothetical protein